MCAAGWNSHEPKRLFALMTEDIVYDDTAWPTQIRGHEGIRPFLEPPGFAPTGATADFQGVDFHEYRDGKLAQLRIDFDLMDFSRQVGLLPAHGSRAERTMTALQRVGAKLKR